MCKTVSAWACSILVIAKIPIKRTRSNSASAKTWNSREKCEALEMSASATPAAESATKKRFVRAAETDQVEPR
jgi:ribosomal protein L14E/L6E/L27E